MRERKLREMPDQRKDFFLIMGEILVQLTYLKTGKKDPVKNERFNM